MNEDGGKDLNSEVEAIKTAQAAAVATQAGQAATTAATFAGTWSTLSVGAVMLFVGVFLGLSLNHR